MAVIISAAWSVGRKSVRSPAAVGLFLAACLGSLTRINPVWLLAIAGLMGFLLKLGNTASRPQRQRNPQESNLMLALPGLIQVLPHRFLTIIHTAPEPC